MASKIQKYQQNHFSTIGKNLKYIAVAAVAMVVSSCSDDDKPSVNTPVNEEEVITTVITTLTNGSQIITLTSRDLDGDGPNAPIVTASGNLTANTTYIGTVKFLNELVNPADDITEEIREESDEHQIFFQAPAVLGTFGYTDLDENGKPVGLQFTYSTSNAASGNLIVTLIHEPNKNAEGVAAGNITNAGGATDAQISYPIVVAE